jgi:heterotetrameric sarcosine oxidase gamma subunit
VREGSATLIGIAPERLWLIEEKRERRDLSAMPAGLWLTSLTEGRERFRLRGRRCLEVLAKCVAIDWAEPGWPEERAVQTMLHRVPVLLHRKGRVEFDLYVPRSFARSLEEWMGDAAREFLRE